VGAFFFARLKSPAEQKFREMKVKPPLPQIHSFVLLLTDFFSFKGKTRG